MGSRRGSEHSIGQNFNMKLLLSLCLLGLAAAGQDYKMFMKWAKTKAMESCWGEDNMKFYKFTKMMDYSDNYAHKQDDTMEKMKMMMMMKKMMDSKMDHYEDHDSYAMDLFRQVPRKSFEPKKSHEY